ncbi:MAG: FAD-dependent thymidylate synthase [Patescibacteria group bacterium]|nr:FAD-dependent thymidylate synthase [Patescibacteria group bacterium]
MIKEEHLKIFESLGGKIIEGFPIINSQVYYTAQGTLYLKEPGVIMIAQPKIRIENTEEFLKGYQNEFEEYLKDPNKLTSGTQLIKFSAQLCYMSFGPKRTWNKDAERYFENIISSGHGSVLEHSYYTFLLYGISRSLTHELIRHRAGFAYSQQSQRYVSGNLIRFVERKEFQQDQELHRLFEMRIDKIKKEYDEIYNLLKEKQESLSILGQSDKEENSHLKTELRKKLNQCARAIFNNETEAPIVVTANIRAWRHTIEMRANNYAETEIRELFFRIFLCLAIVEPILFKDYEIIKYDDGFYGVKTKWKKV